MSASASEVRQYAVAACAWCARQDERTRGAFEQARATIFQAFAGNGTAIDLLGEIKSQAEAVTEARRYLQAYPMDTDADDDFQRAVSTLEDSTQQLIGLAEQRG